jgi:hypothetical protein
MFSQDSLIGGQDVHGKESNIEIAIWNDTSMYTLADEMHQRNPSTLKVTLMEVMPVVLWSGKVFEQSALSRASFSVAITQPLQIVVHKELHAGMKVWQDLRCVMHLGNT